MISKESLFEAKQDLLESIGKSGIRTSQKAHQKSTALKFKNFKPHEALQAAGEHDDAAQTHSRALKLDKPQGKYDEHQKEHAVKRDEHLAHSHAYHAQAAANRLSDHANKHNEIPFHREASSAARYAAELIRSSAKSDARAHDAKHYDDLSAHHRSKEQDLRLI